MGTWNGIELDGLELQSEDVLLRPWRAEDAPRVAEIMRDERMSQYVPLPRPYTLADAQEFVTGYASDGRRNGTRIEWAAEVSGTVIASAGLQLPGAGREPEIGYWVDSAHWGQGYGTRITRALADFGFSSGLHRIEVRVDVANAASAVVAMRAGFRFEAVLRRSNRSQQGYADHALFARLAEDSGRPVEPALPRLRELSDGTVSLRPVQGEDWPVIYAEAADEESRRWGFGGDEPNADSARRRAEAGGLSWLVGRGAELIILDARSNQPAGVLSLRHTGPPGVVAIGYGILPEFRGQRFTSRALRLLVDWAFEHTSIARLELGCKADNVASARSAELAGFRPEGRLAGRLRNPDGGYSDEIIFGLARP